MALDAPEALLGFGEAGGGPPQAHVAVAPALDVAACAGPSRAWLTREGRAALTPPLGVRSGNERHAAAKRSAAADSIDQGAAHPRQAGLRPGEGASRNTRGVARSARRLAPAVDCAPQSVLPRRVRASAYHRSVARTVGRRASLKRAYSAGSGRSGTSSPTGSRAVEHGAHRLIDTWVALAVRWFLLGSHRARRPVGTVPDGRCAPPLNGGE